MSYVSEHIFQSSDIMPDLAIQAAEEIEQLELENAELRKDKARLDWLADVDNNIGGVYLPNDCVMQNIADMREAIDMAMSLYKQEEVTT